MKNTNIELTEKERDDQYYKPYEKAKHESIVKDIRAKTNYTNQVTDEFRTIHNTTGSLPAKIMADYVMYPISLILNLFGRLRGHSRKKIYESSLLEGSSIHDYAYKLDRFIRQIDAYTKKKFNFELFKTSVKPDYLTKLRQKTEELNNIQLSYEDELGI